MPNATIDISTSSSLSLPAEAPKKPRRIIVRRKQQNKDSGGGHGLGKDDRVVIDPVLYEQVTSALPSAYQFEIRKTVERCYELTVRHVALQLPEGLLLYATVIADILLRLVPCLQRVSILGDVTYGACCIDDITAQLLGAQLLVHYGHSCLVPMHYTSTNVPILYVFVEIQFTVHHLVDCFLATMEQQQQKPQSTQIFLLGTVQFRHALVMAKSLLIEKGWTNVCIPQVKPLSPGEVLGCTSPILDTIHNNSVVCFVADGRFHLESTMISNPHITAYYRYDPYSRTITHEHYDHRQMKEIRKNAIQAALTACFRNPTSSSACTKIKGNVTSPDGQPSNVVTFGIILGTLGRQGNPAILQRIKEVLSMKDRQTTTVVRHFTILLSEITPAKLQLFGQKVQVWIQVACPRLSIDWGHYFGSVPVLSPYELFCCFDPTQWIGNFNNDDDCSSDDLRYPMDFYSNDGGPWSNYHASNKNRSMTKQIQSSTISGVCRKEQSSLCCKKNDMDECSSNLHTAS